MYVLYRIVANILLVKYYVVIHVCRIVHTYKKHVIIALHLS
jgi:hypothetical protein